MMEAWRTLGYPSWGAMREAEYGGAAFMVPSKNRPELVARIKAIEVGRTTRGESKHLTNQEIADMVGVSESQVRSDLRPVSKNANSDAFDDVIDAEVVDAETGELINTPDATTGPAPAMPSRVKEKGPH